MTPPIGADIDSGDRPHLRPRAASSLRFAALPLLLALAACGAPNGPPLVSAQFPPGTGMVNTASTPQPLNSLPPGAANLSPAPGGVQANYGSIALRL